MTEIASDYDVLMARVERGELAPGNLVQMILGLREELHDVGLEVKHWQVLCNEIKAASTPEQYYLTLPSDAELVELILWLAIPWDDNDPLFPESDGWTPRALDANRRMARTWQRVVRGSSTGAVPDEKGDGDAIESISS